MSGIASPATVLKVLAVATQVAKHSWEYGTVSQALLDWHNPELSIWNNPFPGGNAVPHLNPDEIQALSYIKPFIVTNDPETLVGANGAAGDPAALGVAAFMIGQRPEGHQSSRYYNAAVRQSSHLLDDVPRWSNGAISHRESHPELWSDFIYMVPPFLAYHGVVSNNLHMLKQAADQCAKYQQVLGTSQGPWRHISGREHRNSDPETRDERMWSSGNGWATAGMARVIATMRRSSFDAQTKGEQSMLAQLVKQIVDGVIALDTEGQDQIGLLRNYLDSSFPEIAGTAMIAAATLRMAVLEPGLFGKEYTDWAVKKVQVVDAHILDSGIVGPAVNPLDWWSDSPDDAYWEGSPEGQGFTVLMHAAYRDWANQGN